MGDKESVRICCQWLEKAYEEGNKTPRNSDMQSEYYAPLFHYQWAPQMLKEIAEAVTDED